MHYNADAFTLKVKLRACSATFNEKTLLLFHPQQLSPARPGLFWRLDAVPGVIRDLCKRMTVTFHRQRSQQLAQSDGDPRVKLSPSLYLLRLGGNISNL